MSTRTRIALLAIAVIAGGLIYVRLAGGGDDVKVPAGARAGALTLKPCSYHGLPADCGTLVVPENRRKPGSRLIALPVTRVHGGAGTPLFRLEGGPGLTNMDFAAVKSVARGRDVVLVGYRGVDGSVRLDCPEVVDSLRRASDMLAPKALDARAGAYRECARRLTASGIDLAGYTVPQRVEDLEAARRALGYAKIDLLSESAGTRTALIYGWRHPSAVRRSVMIAANPPGNFVWNPATTDALIRRHCADCSLTIPKRWGPLRIKPGNVRAGSFFGLMEATSAAGPLNAPATLDAWHDASGMWLLSTVADLAFPRAQVWGDVAAVGRLDAAAARAHFAHRRDSILGDAGSELIWAGGRLVNAWPATPDDNAFAAMRDSDVETLVISGELDGATPAVNATRELMPHLPRGRQVILRGYGHTGDFWAARPAAAKLINTYLDSGRLDASGFLTPKTDFTRDSKVAKLVVGVLAALALAMVAMLVVLARRRRERPVARSLGTVLLGLGGWSLGALMVWTAFPTVPLDSVDLAVLSIGVPIGVGCFLGWRGPRLAGAAAACSGALFGAWLGFGAASGFAAVATTILGAAAGANLMLIATRELQRGRVMRGSLGSWN